jgi:hypothetical protein
MTRMWVAGALMLTLTGCFRNSIETNPDPRDEDPLFGSNVPVHKAPTKDRCAPLKQSAARSSCEDARYLATEYTRRLSPGDEVCIEGGYGEEPGSGCLARAAVIDVGTNRVKLEIRGARPDSRWFNSEMRHAWYEEGALVDLYLSERGY